MKKIFFAFLGMSLMSGASFAYEFIPRIGSDCIRLGCLHHDCSFDRALEEIAVACSNVPDNSCMHTLCNVRGDCDFMDRFKHYADLCAGRTPDEGAYPTAGNLE